MTTTVTVTAIFGEDDASRQKDVVLELDDRGWIHMKGGPTGYESMHPSDMAAGEVRPWVANMGSDRYEPCVVPAYSMEKALRAFGFIR